jgi:hemerythrin superfamily protein
MGRRLGGSPRPAEPDGRPSGSYRIERTYSMDTTAVLSGSPISDHRPNPTRGSPLRLVDPSPEDAANVLVEVHARVAQVFAAYEAAEGSHARQYRALGVISIALGTHVAVEDELVFPAVRALTGRHDAELERQRQQDHLLDLLMVELGGMVPSDRYFDAKVHVLMQVFGQHVRDCEAVVMPELRRRLDASEREQLGRRVLERIQQLEGRPRPGW